MTAIAALRERIANLNRVADEFRANADRLDRIIAYLAERKRRRGEPCTECGTTAAGQAIHPTPELGAPITASASIFLADTERLTLTFHVVCPTCERLVYYSRPMPDWERRHWVSVKDHPYWADKVRT